MAIATNTLRKTGAVVPIFSRNEKTSTVPPDLGFEQTMKIRHILVLFFIGLIFSQAVAAASDKNKEQRLLELHKHYAKEYDFSLGNTFSGFIVQIPTWKKCWAH